uniref:hypothetical protein n=1 Tax=uncultured Caulobacter sp. TaxID=158749 RepID=UPI0025E76254|nr:hypothetical protein [uncultured Caulobacter sp.]
MKAPKLNTRSWVIALGALLGGLLIGGAAWAQCNSGCPPTPPSCCKPPPAPPRPPAPPTGCCGGGGHNVNIPGVNVNIGATVIVNANASATANAGASSGAGSLAGSAAGVTNYYGGGAHGGYYSGPMLSGYIQGLNVEGGEARRRQAYEATRTRTRRVIIRAVCLDDRDVPHPASQVTPDRDIDDLYDGELYRCIAGSRMQYVIADYSGQIDISTGSGGQTYICQKNEALYHVPGAGPNGGQGGSGTLSCRPQRPARDCNERSLLRRFGAGVKILTIITTEKYTAYREETVQERQSLTTSFSLDGGVGGVVY